MKKFSRLAQQWKSHQWWAHSHPSPVEPSNWLGLPLVFFPSILPLITVLISESLLSICPIHFLCLFLIVRILLHSLPAPNFLSFAYLQYLCVFGIMLFSFHVRLRLCLVYASLPVNMHHCLKPPWLRGIIIWSYANLNALIHFPSTFIPSSRSCTASLISSSMQILNSSGDTSAHISWFRTKNY